MAQAEPVTRACSPPPPPLQHVLEGFPTLQTLPLSPLPVSKAQSRRKSEGEQKRPRLSARTAHLLLKEDFCSCPWLTILPPSTLSQVWAPQPDFHLLRLRLCRCLTLCISHSWVHTCTVTQPAGAAAVSFPFSLSQSSHSWFVLMRAVVCLREVQGFMLGLRLPVLARLGASGHGLHFYLWTYERSGPWSKVHIEPRFSLGWVL